MNVFGLFRKPAKSIHVLNGHYIGQNEENKDVFDILLSKIKDNSKFTNIEVAVENIRKKNIQNESQIAFTFDDGYLECYTKIAPALNKQNVNAAFFVCPNFIDQKTENLDGYIVSNSFTRNKYPMDWYMINQLVKAGFIIGSHTLDHVNLKICKPSDLKKQIIDSKNVIEDRTGVSCEYFAWPYGTYEDISPLALEMALENYKYVFSACDYKNYLSNNKLVINRRHFEGNWPITHLNYFLSFQKRYT